MKGMNRVMVMKMQIAAEKFHCFYIYNTASQVLQVTSEELALSLIFR
jgi:hypothetical protein